MGGSAAPSLYRCIRWEGAQRGNHGKSSSAAIQFRARHGCGAAEVALSGCLRDTNHLEHQKGTRRLPSDVSFRFVSFRFVGCQGPLHSQASSKGAVP